MPDRRFPPPWTIEDNGALGHRPENPGQLGDVASPERRRQREQG